ncbi:MAG: hypothetical protein ACK5H4_25540 [Lacrimispora sphenoides]
MRKEVYHEKENDEFGSGSGDVRVSVCSGVCGNHSTIQFYLMCRVKLPAGMILLDTDVSINVVNEKLKKAIEETAGLDMSHTGDYTVAAWLHTWYQIYSKPNIRLATQNRYKLRITFMPFLQLETLNSAS